MLIGGGEKSRRKGRRKKGDGVLQKRAVLKRGSLWGSSEERKRLT